MFMCQRNPKLTEFTSQVLSCKPVEDVELINQLLKLATNVPNIGSSSNEIQEVVLEDTILFPEGGGQPDDHGLINNHEVIRVIRNGNQALHYVKLNESPGKSIFDKDETVSIKLDWERRFDHMQQHSGQHLISAIALKMFGFETTSWWLGTKDSTSFIELNAKDITDSNMRDLEEEVNLKIRYGIPLTVDVVGLDDPKLKTARERNLPSDITEKIRIVTIDGVESNVCCGTHVSTLTEIQAIKLLFVEKKKGKCLLHFLAGNRILSKLGDSFQREQMLTQSFSCPPAELVIAAEKLNLALKISKKSCENLCKDLAKLEAKQFLSSIAINTERFWHYHRDNVDFSFGQGLLREIGVTKDTIILVTLKTDTDSGQLMLRGAENVIDADNLQKLGDLLCSQLNGKGTVRGNLYQAKITKVNGVAKAVKSAKEFLAEFCKAPASS